MLDGSVRRAPALPSRILLPFFPATGLTRSAFNALRASPSALALRLLLSSTCKVHFLLPSAAQHRNVPLHCAATPAVGRRLGRWGFTTPAPRVYERTCREGGTRGTTPAGKRPSLASTAGCLERRTLTRPMAFWILRSHNIVFATCRCIPRHTWRGADDAVIACRLPAVSPPARRVVLPRHALLCYLFVVDCLSPALVTPPYRRRAG